MRNRTSYAAILAALCIVGIAVPSAAWADPPKRIGGHVGFVIPLVSHSGGQTTTVADNFVIGFPTGFGLKKFGRAAIDMEVVPVLQNQPRHMSLELHPGVVFGVSPNVAAGIRAAFDVEGEAWGFTPLVNRTLYVAETHSVFGEVVVPVRFHDAPNGSRSSVGLGVHIGIGF
jgi:hypothetical protein